MVLALDRIQKAVAREIDIRRDRHPDGGADLRLPAIAGKTREAFWIMILIKRKSSRGIGHAAEINEVFLSRHVVEFIVIAIDPLSASK
jgi:hypothetical protein